MRRVTSPVILAIGVLHVHCACGAFEAPLSVIAHASSEESDHHSHPKGAQVCAADHGMLPQRQVADAPPATPLGIAAPEPPILTAHRASIVPEPCAVLLAFRLASTEPSRAPPTS